MTNRHTLKRTALVGMLLVLLLVISGCLSTPDVIDTVPTDSGVVLPFPTTTPSPVPSATTGGVQPDGDSTDINTDGSEQGGNSNLIGIGFSSPGTGQGQVASTTPTPSPSPSPSPSPTEGSLRNGSTGQSVRNLQQRLKDLGYYTGSVDGDFGSGTESALKEFQKQNGLTADGVAGKQTMSVINSSNAKSKPKSTPTPKPTLNPAYATSRPTPKSYSPSTPGTYRYLQNGSSGSDVTRLQNRLKELGYYKGTVNGRYDDATEAAVRAFQERNGEWVDGVAGEDTQKTLFGSTALPASAGGSSAVPNSGYRTLDSGASGEDVTRLQERLIELGYLTEKATGAYDSQTANAISQFQVTNGIVSTGVADNVTQVRIHSASALYAPVTEPATITKATFQSLENGSMGDEVYRLQERLYDLGYYTGRIDGIYSDEVTEAVRAFQKASGISADGKAGKTTQAKLYGDKAMSAPGVSGDDPYSTLREGDSGERVRALQSLLETYGYFTESINGVYGPSTTAAVQQMQALNGIYADGVAGPATQQLLYEGSPLYATAAAMAIEEGGSASAANYAALQNGSSGPDVMMLQEFLSDLGYFSTDASGTFGDSTMIALQEFQERNGLKADGVAGADTLELLYSGAGVPAAIYAQEIIITPERDIMQSGDIGQDVFTMQERLLQLGYLTSDPDGIFSEATKTAVYSFQKSNGLKADGVAGQETITALFSAMAVPALSVATQVATVPAVDNTSRELSEQAASGAIQVNLSGGGVAASYESSVYYAGRGGNLYRISGSSDKMLYEGAAAFIHASGKGVTFASGNRILRIPSGGGKAEELVRAKSIKKLAVVGNTLFYQDGNTLYRLASGGKPQIITEGINDFFVDVFQHIAYTASATGIESVGLNGHDPQQLVSTPADQVLIGDSVVFFRSGGNIYRIDDGVGSLLLDKNASWMGIYRDKLYYIGGGILYRCDTSGGNIDVFYAGDTYGVSFVSGNAYITSKANGPVTQVLPVSEG